MAGTGTLACADAPPLCATEGVTISATLASAMAAAPLIQMFFTMLSE